MSLIIDKIVPNSLADSSGFKPGESIVSINGMPVRDFLDLEYYASDYELLFKIKTEDGRTKTRLIKRDSNLPLGIEPIAHKQRNCCNNCVFCFIDQMPKGLRPSLYVKDDDYLFSRVFGNYITLTNLSRRDLERIAEQHISPIYISVHTTDNDLRRKMMRYERDFDISDTLKWLKIHGISYHVQIVCVPGFNDGDELVSSVRDLLSSKLSTLSVGIVPVGLTRCRDGLPSLRPFTKAAAVNLLTDMEKLGRDLKASIIYCADEFYVLAERDVPGADHYKGYPQLENGIGMLRLAMDTYSKMKPRFRKALRDHGGQYLLLCSDAAEGCIGTITKGLNHGRGRSSVRMQAIHNVFFGPLISVSGLLTYADIIQQAKPNRGEAVIIPDNMFNTDGLTLDGYSVEDLKRDLGRELLVVDSFFAGWHWV
jgi:putative radical SAM enzyme (TIGR03279 family)